MTRVLFVCLGNICRSPAAQGILERDAEQQGLDLEIASCALGDWHKGSLPDPRMRKAAEKRGLDLNSRAMVFKPKFFDIYDYILVADRSVFAEVESRGKVRDNLFLITHFSKRWKDKDVPDPYHGTEEDFEIALNILEEACSEFCNYLIAKGDNKA